MITRILTLLVLAACARTALADCTTTAGSADLGQIDSVTLYQARQSAEASSGFACTASTLSLITTNYISVTLSSSTNGSGTQPRLYNANAGAYVPYTAYTDSAYTRSLTIGGSYRWSITSLLGLLGLFNSSAGTLPLYLATNVGANVPAGVYVDNLNLSWDYTLCLAGVLLCLVEQKGTLPNTIPVTLVVANICMVVDAPDVDFGTAALPSAFNQVSGNLQVRCTLQAGYTVGLSSASSGSDWREMAGAGPNNAAYTLQYRIYRQDGTAWTPDNALTGTGSGLAQNLPYTAGINAGQNSVPAGRYSDTVTVTVSY